MVTGKAAQVFERALRFFDPVTANQPSGALGDEEETRHENQTWQGLDAHGHLPLCVLLAGDVLNRAEVDPVAKSNAQHGVCVIHGRETTTDAFGCDLSNVTRANDTGGARAQARDNAAGNEHVDAVGAAWVGGHQDGGETEDEGEDGERHLAAEPVGDGGTHQRTGARTQEKRRGDPSVEIRHSTLGHGVEAEICLEWHHGEDTRDVGGVESCVIVSGMLC